MSFFHGITCLLIPNVLGKSKAEFFTRKLKEFGGRGFVFNVKGKLDTLSTYTHVIIDPSLSYSQLEKILGTTLLQFGGKVVTSKWLTKCLESQSLEDSDPYILQQPGADVSSFQSSSKESARVSIREGPSPSKLPRTVYNSPDDTQQSGYSDTSTAHVDTSTAHVDTSTAHADTSTAHADTSTAHVDTSTVHVDTSTAHVDTSTAHVGTSTLNKSKFICMNSSVSSGETIPNSSNINKHIIEKLQEMVETYKSTKDKWRVFGYEKAIIALKAAKHPIDTYKKALALPHVGKSLAEKIAEIAERGSFEKLEKFQSDDSLQSVKLFMRIWGVGAEKANQWTNQGLRSLDDVREKASLTANQKVGLKYFHELDERMQRDEVSRIEKVVEEAVREIDRGLEMVVCGSYRRGQATCGDVDILITHSDGVSHAGVFHKLLNKLHTQEFLTDDLTIATHMKGGMMKYLGICKLNELEAKHRRIDIIVTPYNQYGCCLVYFTGSTHFNRSIRLMADKMGLSLTEHALYKDVIRGPNNEIIHHGVVVSTPTEQSVFDYLGVPYRPPHERDHD